MFFSHRNSVTPTPDKLTTATFSKFSDRIAMIWNDDEVSYTNLANRMIIASEKLKRHGLHNGDSILLYSPDPELMAAVFLGALRIAVQPGIIPTGLTEKQLQEILSQANAKLLLCDRNFIAQFRGLDLHGSKILYNLPHLETNPSSHDYRFLGKNFIVFAGPNCEHPHWLISSTKFLTPLAIAEQKRFNLHQDDKIFCASGLSGVTSLIHGFLCPLLWGMTTIFANIWTPPKKLNEIIAHHKPTIILATLGQYQSMVKYVDPKLLHDALDNTQYCIAVGERLDIKTVDAWQQTTGLTIIEQPILLTGSRHVDDLAYVVASDSYGDDFTPSHLEKK